MILESLFSKVFNEINERRFRKHNCIPLTRALPRMSHYIEGIQRRYYIVSGASEAGKSQLTDHLFVFEPYNFVTESDTDIDVKILYYSFEVDRESKLKQWMSKRMYDLWGIRTGTGLINGVGDLRLNDSMMMALKETESYFSHIEEKVTIIDTPKTPDEIIKEIRSFAAEHGKFDIRKKEITITNYDGTTKTEEHTYIDSYKPHNPNLYVIIILDHFSLLKLPKGYSVKAAIEELSKAMVQARNLFGFTPVMIQQQTAEKENLEHFKAEKLEPSRDGLAESKLTYNDCDLALGIFSPIKHNLKRHKGYDVSILKDTYRNLNVFKNRYGPGHLNVGLYFDGCVGYFKELPKAEDMNQSCYEMASSRKPKW